MAKSCTYVILLNWNGWKDTIACLESLFQTVEAQFRVVVCDNRSSDESLANIAAWANGSVTADVPDNRRLASLVKGTSMHVDYLMCTSSEIASGCVNDNGEPLILIDNGENLGFAGGNNVGLRYALSQRDMTHTWILNNDTLVDPASRRLAVIVSTDARASPCNRRVGSGLSMSFMTAGPSKNASIMSAVAPCSCHATFLSRWVC
jgi:GT2 family glycosyltransferase